MDVFDFAQAAPVADDSARIGPTSSWESWIQDVGKTVVGGYASANWTQPFELEKLKLQAQAQNGGGFYTEGMPANAARGFGGISPMVLLLAGAAVVAIVMLRD